MRAYKGLFIAVLLAGGVRADPVGMFTDVKDVGVVSRATEASYESTTGTYTIGASGDNIWAGRDAFGFAWKPMSGDAAFAARIEIQGTSAQEHRKAEKRGGQGQPDVEPWQHADGDARPG